MIRREELIEIGSYNKPHGVSGEISASFDYDVDLVSDLKCFISEINGIFVPFFANSIRTKGSNTLLLKIDGFDSDKEAKLLVNRTIYTHKKDFQELNDSEDSECDELPLDYFVGFSIVNDEDNLIGTITDVDCATENYLFIVECNDQQYYIPATEDFIIDINTEKKTLKMSLPEGILTI